VASAWSFFSPMFSNIWDKCYADTVTLWFYSIGDPDPSLCS
jgi:hypothetical protein